MTKSMCILYSDRSRGVISATRKKFLLKISISIMFRFGLWESLLIEVFVLDCRVLGWCGNQLVHTLHQGHKIFLLVLRIELECGILINKGQNHNNCNDQPSKVKLTQERFLSLRASSKEAAAILESSSSTNE